jgi:uncharacterized membrane protein YdbT with pleckstrin-like domain
LRETLSGQRNPGVQSHVMDTAQDAAKTAPAHGSEGEQVLYEGRPALVPSVVALLLSIVTLGTYLIFRYLKVRGTSYRITSRRLVVETGVLSKTLEQVDLYRVTDYSVERPFSQRLMGTGNLILQTVDRTTSQVQVRDIKTDVVALYEQVRSATEADRARRGVKMVDYE